MIMFRSAQGIKKRHEYKPLQMINGRMAYIFKVYRNIVTALPKTLLRPKHFSYY